MSDTPHPMTEEEIVTETVLFYAEDPKRRAFDEASGKCRYRTEDGRKCAVGRCMHERDTSPLFDCGGNVCDLLSEAGLSFTAAGMSVILQDKYQGHRPEFWAWLQELHDAEYVWDRTRDAREELEGQLRTWFDDSAVERIMTALNSKFPIE